MAEYDPLDVSFVLSPRLAADTFPLGDWPLSRVLLMNDARFPWCILVPRRAGLREIHHLIDADQRLMWGESMALLGSLERLFLPHKLNLAALGNMVPQLHVHHIARFEQDSAWPAPVFGFESPEPYPEFEREAITSRFHTDWAQHLPWRTLS